MFDFLFDSAVYCHDGWTKHKEVIKIVPRFAKNPFSNKNIKLPQKHERAIAMRLSWQEDFL